MLILIILILFTVLGVVFIIHGLIQSGMTSDLEKEVTYVVILGAGLRDDQPSLSLWYRLEAAIKYMRKHPESIVIASGGLGIGERYMEAEVMKRFLVDAGIAAERIIKEEKATNTLENLRYTLELIHDREAANRQQGTDNEIQQSEPRIELMIATSDFHLYRAKMIAKRLGFEPYGVPAKTPAVVAKQLMLREYVAVIKSYLFDR